MREEKSLVPAERIEQSILMIRDQKVMLDRDLAILYGVSTKALNQAVKRREQIPRRLYVPAYRRRGKNLVVTGYGYSFKVTNCDL